MQSVLPHDVSQEQYLFDENGLMKKSQKNTLILQPEKISQGMTRNLI